MNRAATTLLRVSFSILSACLIAEEAGAQLSPTKLYFGIGRPIAMDVALPPGTSGEARIALYVPGGEDAAFTAPVAPGAADLASLFPNLWKPGVGKDAATPPALPRLYYAQLEVGERKIGAPVVLQPMLNPGIFMLYSFDVEKPYFVDPKSQKPSIEPKQGRIMHTPDSPVYSGLCAYVEQHAVFETSLGAIEFRMRPDAAPNTVRNFVQLVEGGFYDDIIFHRVVPRSPAGLPFVIQVGAPTGTGSGGPGYSVDFELSSLPHDFGVLSMARDADPNTNGSQVFVCLSREGTAALDGKYVSFGEAVSGADVILAIGATPVKGDRPVDPPVLKHVKLVPAPPFGMGPQPLKRPLAKDVPSGR
ncbi:MAG: peptidylprolyl isomerase [Phycisphaerales bacterium]|jgi:peptidyl-prolyl cis-trans isomerase B (cyclophilin B)